VDRKAMEGEPIKGRCNAKTRRGTPCRKWPTRWNGKRCYLHGGAPGSGRPPITGRYSEVARGALREKYQHFLGDENWRDLACEVAIERALFAEYLSNIPEGGAPGREDVERMVSWLDKIGRMVERIGRLENATALTAREVQLLETIIVTLLYDYLPSERCTEFAEKLAQALGGSGALFNVSGGVGMEGVAHGRG